MTYRYKNISKERQSLIGIGEVEPGATIETETEINNENFQIVFNSDRKTGVEAAPKKPQK